MKKRYMMVILVLLLILTVCFIIFRNGIMIRLFPKTILSSAAVSAYSQLENRFSNNPLQLPVRVFNSNNQYEAKMNIETENPYLGHVRYDMTVHTDDTQRRFKAEGMALTETGTIDLCLYFDTSFMSVSSQAFEKEKNYGITYNTFRSDIQSIPLLNYIITDELVTQWEDAIQGIQHKLCKKETMPQMPEITDDMLRGISVGILALPCEIERRTIANDNSIYDCQVISYRADSKILDQLLMLNPQKPLTAAEISCYLWDNILLSVQICCQMQDTETVCNLWLGKKPASNPINFQWKEKNSEKETGYNITITTNSNRDIYEESVEIISTHNGTQEIHNLDYHWMLRNKVLNLKWDDTANSASVILCETEDGFRIDSEDFMQLICMFTGNSPYEHTFSGSVIISPGAAVDVPEYVNLDQWSLEDFWVILNELGALAGIQLGI